MSNINFLFNDDIYDMDSRNDREALYRECDFDPKTIEYMFSTEDALDYNFEFTQRMVIDREKTAVLINKIIEEKLTERQRDVIKLYFYYNKTEWEIVKILGLKNQAGVSQHKIYGIKKIRKMLAKRDE